jgi:hypothetical protein
MKKQFYHESTKCPRLNINKGLTPVKQKIRFNWAGRAGENTKEKNNFVLSPP